MKSYALKLIIFQLLKVMNIMKATIIKNTKDGTPVDTLKVQYHMQLQQALKHLRQANSMNIDDGSTDSTSVTNVD